MRNFFTVSITATLLSLALLPWMIQACTPYPLVPVELRQQRAEYEQHAAAAQTATMVAQRNAPSEVKITTATETTETPVPSTPVAPIDGRLTGTPVPTEINGETIHQVTILANSSLDAPGASTSTTVSTTFTHTEQLSTTSVIPVQLKVVKDTITDEMLTKQVRNDIANDAISDLAVAFTPDGIAATATVSWLVFNQPIKAQGTLAIVDESLVANITAITLNGNDVTEQYRSQVEDGIKSSFYRLLPERHVQSFQLSFGQVVVDSQLKAQ